MTLRHNLSTKIATEPLVDFRRKDYPGAYDILNRIFAPIHAEPRIAVECDIASSLITEVEAGRGIALSSTISKLVAGKRLLYARSPAQRNRCVSASPAQQRVT